MTPAPRSFDTGPACTRCPKPSRSAPPHRGRWQQHGAGDRKRRPRRLRTGPVDRPGRFPEGVLFLALSEESDASVRALTRLLVKSFPACVPYGGAHPDPHPHVTVAMGSPSELDAIQGEVAVALDVLLPMTFVRREVVVMEQQPDGTWSQAHRVALGADRS